MRERINIKLATVVLVVFIIAVGGTVLAHRWQVRRNAQGLLELADTATSKGMPGRALWILASYLELAPGDTAARAQYGEVAEGLAREPKSRRAVADVYERVLTETPDRADIRLRLARLYVGDGRFSEAASHLAAIAPSPDTLAEVERLLAASQEGQGNAPAAIEHYRRAIESNSTHVDWFVRLAILLRRDGKASGSSEADKIIDQMIAANPRDARAYLARARYRMQFPKLASKNDPAYEKILQENDSGPDLAKAIELDPDNSEIRLTAAAVAKTTEEARNHLLTALHKHPGEVRLYLALSKVEDRKGSRNEAAAVLHRALNKFPGDPRVLFPLTDLAIEMGNLAEADRLLNEIDRWKRSPEHLVLLRARVRMAEGNWHAGRTLLEAGRPSLTISSLDLAAEADLYLGRCHEQLGEGDLALAAYRRAAGGGIELPAATAGVARALVSLGRLGEAVEQYQQLASKPSATTETLLMFARLRTLQYLSTPPTTRHSADLVPVLDQTDAKVPGATEILLLRAEVLSADRKPAESEKLLRSALAQKQSAEVALPLARLLYRNGRTAEASRVLDALELPSGPTVDSSLCRLEMLPAAPDDPSRQIIREIEKVYSRIERAEERLRLCAGLAETYAFWKNYPEARRWWLEVARLRPQDLSIRLRVFELAVQADNRAQMEEAVHDIHSAEGGSDGAFGHYAEAMLRVARPQDRTPEGVRQAREHLTAAGLQRSTWAVIPSSLALLAESDNKPDEALAEYSRAVELGERRPEVIRRAVQLLCARRRYAEADRLIQKLRPEASASSQILKLAAVVSLFNLQNERAVQFAAGVVAPDSKVSEEHMWQAEILAAAGRGDEAVAAFRRAIDSAGSNGAPWVALIRHYIRSGKRDRAEETFTELRRRLMGPDLPLIVAQVHEAFGRTEEAGEAYRAAVVAHPNDVEALRQLFAFYNQNGTPALAIPFLRQALTAQPPLTPDQSAAVRRALAISLAGNGEHSSFLEALSLTDQALTEAPNDADNQLTKARILATRLSHRREALKSLEELQRRSRFGPAEDYFLGQLYADSGAWTEGRRILVNLLSREGDNPVYLRFFIDRLIKFGHYGEVETWLGRLEGVAPDDIATLRYRAILLVKRGEYRDAAALLTKAAHQRVGATEGPTKTADEQNRLRAAARIANDLGAEPDAGTVLYPVAETLLREALKGGTFSDELALAGFLIRRGRIDEAVKLCRIAEEKAGAIAVAGTLIGAAYGYTPTPLTESHLDAIEAEVKVCIGRAKPSPESATLLGLMYARRGRYADAATSLRKVVDADGKNAAALNNLAYMLILAKANSQEVDALIARALELVGPTAGLLDTRGVLHLEAGRTDEAIADLEQAVDQNPSAAKCLHLATAYRQAGRDKDAATQLARATLLQTDGSLVLPAEQAKYRKLVDEVKKPI